MRQVLFINLNLERPHARTFNAGPVLEIPLDQVRDVFEANTFSILRVSRVVVPHMAARKQGLIVNIGSIVGEMYVPPSMNLDSSMTLTTSTQPDTLGGHLRVVEGGRARHHTGPRNGVFPPRRGRHTCGSGRRTI